MSCGATKDTSSKWMPADQRYTGSLWQTLRSSCHLPDDAGIAVLSARYGLIQGSTMIEDYNTRMTTSLADQMIEEGADALWPKAPAGKCQVSYGNRACYEIISLARHGESPFSRIVLCGGKLYVKVMLALIQEIRAQTDAFSVDAEIEVVSGPIGKMRQSLARVFRAPEHLPLPDKAAIG